MHAFLSQCSTTTNMYPAFIAVVCALVYFIVINMKILPILLHHPYNVAILNLQDFSFTFVIHTVVITRGSHSSNRRPTHHPTGEQCVLQPSFMNTTFSFHTYMYTHTHTHVHTHFLSLSLSQDEPTTGMDSGTRHYLWDVLTGVTREGRSIILTTHSLNSASSFVCTHNIDNMM